MKAILFFLALANSVSAEPLAKIVEARLSPALPQGYGITKVFAPELDVDAKRVSVEVPGEIKLGRPSIKVTINGSTRYVPVQVGKLVEVAVATHDLTEGDALTAADFSIELRAADNVAVAGELGGARVQHAVKSGAPIGKLDVQLAPPLPRGMEVALEIRHGRIRVRGTAILEANARPGGPAIARVAQTKTLVHGTLVAPSTLVVGEAQ